MKKTITTLMLAHFTLAGNSQSLITDFETFTLTTNSFYKDTNSVPFQTQGVLFRHEWANGQFPYWSGGFSYTNKNDTTNGNFMNLYNCRAGKGYNNSEKYATGQNNATMVLKAPYDKLDGFYITNTTYAYKSMKNGDQFAKKFGGTTGNDPDWFKVTAKGYFAGALKTDSAVFYLADFRFANNSADYIVQNWQWFNTSNLGEVDSVKFFMYSSDTTGGYINTPAFFSLDEVTISDAYVGLEENNFVNNLRVSPNPFSSLLNINSESKISSVRIMDVTGKTVYFEEKNDLTKQIDLQFLQAGIYFAEIRSNNYTVVKKIVKD